MKRICIILLSITVLLGVLAFPASAQEIQVGDEKSFMQALADGGEVILVSDISLTSYVDVFNDVTIDLNGHKILAAENSYGSILNRYGCTLVIRDLAGGGEIGTEEIDTVSVNSETGELIIESGSVWSVNATGGRAEIKGGTVGMLQFASIRENVTVYKHDAATVKEWGCQKGTVNIDPTAYLIPGFTSTKNQDGTYTVDTVTVEKSGQTITFYYDAYRSKTEEFALTEDGSAPRELRVEILYVNDGDPELIPMTKRDDEGRLWSAQIDKAYFGAQMHVANNDAGFSTWLLDVPEVDGAKFNGDNEWILPSGSGSNWWIWVTVAIAAVAVAGVAFILLRKKKN